MNQGASAENSKEEENQKVENNVPESRPGKQNLFQKMFDKRKRLIELGKLKICFLLYINKFVTKFFI